MATNRLRECADDNCRQTHCLRMRWVSLCATHPAIHYFLELCPPGLVCTRTRKGTAMSKPIAKLALVLALFCAGQSSSVAQPGHAGTPQEQQACSRDSSRFCRKQLG